MFVGRKSYFIATCSKYRFPEEEEYHHPPIHQHHQSVECSPFDHFHRQVAAAKLKFTEDEKKKERRGRSFMTPIDCEARKSFVANSEDHFETMESLPVFASWCYGMEFDSQNLNNPRFRSSKPMAIPAPNLANSMSSSSSFGSRMSVTEEQDGNMKTSPKTDIQQHMSMHLAAKKRLLQQQNLDSSSKEKQTQIQEYPQQLEEQKDGCCCPFGSCSCTNEANGENPTDSMIFDIELY